MEISHFYSIVLTQNISEDSGEWKIKLMDLNNQSSQNFYNLTEFQAYIVSLFNQAIQENGLMDLKKPSQ